VPSVNDKILDEITGYSVDLQRLESSVKIKIRKELKKLEQSLVKELNTSKLLEAKRTQTKVKRLKTLLKQTEETIVSTYKTIAKDHTKILTGVASLAEKQAVKSINTAIKFEITSVSMSKQMLKAIASDTLIEGAPSAEWWSRRGKAFQARFSDTIRQGMMRGDDTGTITRALIGTNKNKFKDGALQVNRRSAEALVRTSIQSVANESRLMTYADNDDVIKEIEWVSTLDSRTTQTCISLDGLKWRNPDKKPVGHNIAFVGTTAHWGCRSTQVPITKSWEELGAKGKFKEIPESTRASMDGQVSEKLGYEGWLKTKPKEFQREVLGKKKYELWGKGKLSFTDMVNQSGNALTLEQLGVKLAKPKAVPKPKKVVEAKPKLKTRKEVESVLTAQLTKNVKDSRYIDRPRKYYGQANLKGLTNEASVMFKNALDEADLLLLKVNIQGIRSIQPIKGNRRAMATMGGGRFSFKKKYFNQYAAGLNEDELKRLSKKAKETTAKLLVDIEPAKKRLKKVGDALDADNVTDEMRAAYKKARKEYNLVVRRYNRSLNSQASQNYLFYRNSQKTSTWKVGDSAIARPHHAGSYFKGGEKRMTSVVHHEFGHQIHQQFGVKASQQTPPLENVLNQLFKDKRTVTPTKYAGTNHKEWFAENYSLYSMGRKDLVDPLIKDLLQQMEKGIIKDTDSLYTWLRGVYEH